MRITHFDIITEYVVKGNLQARDAGLFTFPLLYLNQVILAGISNGTQLIQFRIDPFGYDTAFIQQRRRIVIDLLFYPVAYLGTSIQLFADTGKARLITCHTSLFDRFDRTESDFQLHHFTRGNAAYSHFRNNTFQVADLLDLFIQYILYLRMTEEIIHHILTVPDRFDIFQGEQHPAAQHTRSHRGNRLVYHIQQAGSLIVHRTDQFQAAYRKFIETHITVFLDT